MRKSGLQIIILLTAIVGFIVSANGQVDSLRTSYSEDSSATGFQDSLITDSLQADTVGNRINMNTDSVYATPVQREGFLTDEVEYTASDSIIGSPVNGYAELYNEAYVKYQDITLTAGYIRIDFNKNEVFAEGIPDSSGKIVQKPVFTEQGKSYLADRMRYNFDTKKAKIKKVITTEGEGFLHGEEVKKEESGIFYVKNASYTTCSHEHPHFRIMTPKAKLIPGEKVITQFAYIEVLDVPTPLMVPFGFFPTTERRKSGIIIPSYGNNQYRGYFLQNGGYYWAINDYLDLTLTGDIYTQGGYGWKAQTNYRKRYAYSGNLNLSYNLLRFGRPEFSEFIGNAYDNRSDFAIQWSHSQDQKAHPNFRFNANVNIASSNYYRVTSVNPSDVLQNRLNSSVSIAKSWPGKPFNLNVSARHSQNNASEDLTVTLPQVNFALNRQFPFKRKLSAGKKKWYEEIGITYTADAANEIQTKLGEPFFTESVFTDSARNGIRHNIPISANYKILNHLVFTPSFNYNERWYTKRRDYYFVDSLNRAFYDTAQGFFANRDFSASASFSTKLYGLLRYKGFVKAVRHVMTPTVGFTYKPDFSVSKWGYYQELTDTLGRTQRYDRYAGSLYGGASAGKQGNINMGIQNTLEAKVRSRTDTSGEKKIKILERFSVNTAYNTAVQEFNWQNLSVTASSSAFQGLLNVNYSSNFSFYGYDEEQGLQVNRSAYEVNGKWLRPVNQRFTTGINLSADRFSRSGEKREVVQGQDNDEKEGMLDDQPKPGGGLGISEGDPDYYNMPGFVDFDLPWSVNINYNINKSYRGLESNINQSVDVSGDIKLTENWKIGFRTGYDIEAKDFTYTSLDFYRDLHCWELRCTWIPFGFQQSYTLTIRVKSQMLSDLKLERRRGVGDFINN